MKLSRKTIYPYFMFSITFLLGFSLSAQTFALEPTLCYDAKFSEVRSLSEFPSKMPPGLVALTEGISDRNGSFNSFDVGAGPRKRFSFAAISQDCILIAIEYGGRAYGISLWYFIADGSKWQQSQKLRYWDDEPPQTLKEFLVGAQNSFGAMYQHGWGLPKNDVESIKWYRKAAGQENDLPSK